LLFARRGLSPPCALHDAKSAAALQVEGKVQYAILVFLSQLESGGEAHEEKRRERGRKSSLFQSFKNKKGRYGPRHRDAI
jgi:hypothetical protein